MQPNVPAAQAEATAAPQDRHEISKGQTAVLPGRQSTKDADKTDSSGAAAGDRGSKVDGASDDIESVIARVDAYNAYKDDKKNALNPYDHGGVIDREQAAKDAKAWYKFKNEAVGASAKDVETATTSNADPRDFGRAEEALKNARQHEAEVYLAGGEQEDAEAGKNEILTKGLVRGVHDKELKAIQDTGVNLGLDRAGFAKGKPGESAQDRLKDLASRQRRGEDVSSIGNDAPVKGPPRTGPGSDSGASSGSGGNAVDAPAKDPPPAVVEEKPKENKETTAKDPKIAPIPPKPVVSISEPTIIKKHKPPKPRQVIIGTKPDGTVGLGLGPAIDKVPPGIANDPRVTDRSNYLRGIPDAGEKGTVDEDLNGPVTGKTGRSGGGPPTPPPLFDKDDQKKSGPTWDNSTAQRDRYHGGTQGQASGSGSTSDPSQSNGNGSTSGHDYGSHDQSAHNDEPLDDPKEQKAKDPDKPATDTASKEPAPKETKAEDPILEYKYPDDEDKGLAVDGESKKGDTTTGPDSPDSGTAVGSKPNPVDGGPVNLPPGYVRRKGPIDQAIEQGKPKRGGEKINPGAEGEGHRASSGAVDAAKKLNGMLGNPGSADKTKPQAPSLGRAQPGADPNKSNPAPDGTDEVRPLPGDTQKQFGEKGAGNETSVDAPHGQTSTNTETDSSNSSSTSGSREQVVGKTLKDQTILDAVLAAERKKQLEQMTKKTIKPN